MKRLILILCFFVVPAHATQVSDNFSRPDGALGGCWSTVHGITPGEGVATTSGGGAQIINHAYAPINAKGGDAYSIYDCGVTFGNNQYVSATISTIAAYTSQVSITAATQSGTSMIYTYTLTSGSPLITPQCFLISGMSDSGNNTNGGV